jgi:copper chaperone CopZ
VKTLLTIKGTHCVSCKALIEDVCKDIPGVQSCSVDDATGRTEVEHEPSLDTALLKKEIESLGPYSVESLQTLAPPSS